VDPGAAADGPAAQAGRRPRHRALGQARPARRGPASPAGRNFRRAGHATRRRRRRRRPIGRGRVAGGPALVCGVCAGRRAVVCARCSAAQQSAYICEGGDSPCRAHPAGMAWSAGPRALRAMGVSDASFPLIAACTCDVSTSL
jgi:hypothetical protein